MTLSWWLACAALAAPGLWALGAILIDIQTPGLVLGADAGETLVLHFGEWGLRVLLVTLALSSLRRRAGFTQALRFRRLAGLTAFTYLSLHFLAYLWFFAGMSLAEIGADLAERSYITAGFAAWLILLPLALTSTRGWQRRLRRRWQQLHRLIYLAIPVGLVHLLWLTKAGFAEVLVYGGVYVVLMLERRLALRSPRTAPADIRRYPPS